MRMASYTPHVPSQKPDAGWVGGTPISCRGNVCSVLCNTITKRPIIAADNKHLIHASLVSADCHADEPIALRILAGSTVPGLEDSLTRGEFNYRYVYPIDVIRSRSYPRENLQRNVGQTTVCSRL